MDVFVDWTAWPPNSMLAAIETKRCDSQASDQAQNQGCHLAWVAVPARLGSQLERPLVAAKLLEGEEAEL